MTLPQPDHPLMQEEFDLYNRCAHMWNGDGFAMGSIKCGELTDAFKQRLRCLALVSRVNVEFQFFLDQHYIFATRPRVP